MPDQRKHRGCAPEDPELFDAGQLGALQSASSQLAWLLSRGYRRESALKLVGDRHALRKRQRDAVSRATCDDEQARKRASRRASLTEVTHLNVDGFNVLTTLEVALSGGIVVAGRDGCYRDLAGVHGTYRFVEESDAARNLVAQYLTSHGVTSVTWFLDRPVSNSGRVAEKLQAMAVGSERAWEIRLCPDPDPELARAEAPVATADAWVLDRCASWVSLAREIVDACVPMARVVAVSPET